MISYYNFSRVLGFPLPLWHLRLPRERRPLRMSSREARAWAMAVYAVGKRARVHYPEG